MVKLKVNSFLKYKFINFVSIILSLIIILAIMYLAFWELNILKQETSIDPEITEISNELTKLNEIKFFNISEELRKKLPAPQVLSQPTISPEMIGKNNWFE